MLGKIFGKVPFLRLFHAYSAPHPEARVRRRWQSLALHGDTMNLAPPSVACRCSSFRSPLPHTWRKSMSAGSGPARCTMDSRWRGLWSMLDPADLTKVAPRKSRVVMFSSGVHSTLTREHWATHGLQGGREEQEQEQELGEHWATLKLLGGRAPGWPQVAPGWPLGDL